MLAAFLLVFELAAVASGISDVDPYRLFHIGRKLTPVASANIISLS
jgi:hypothetical protein